VTSLTVALQIARTPPEALNAQAASTPTKVLRSDSKVRRYTLSVQNA
jgi:hypothetical protein